MLDALLELFFEIFGEAISELFCWVVSKVLVEAYDFVRALVNELFK